MKLAACSVLCAALAFGQQFEIADVHVSGPATNPDTFASGGLLRSGRYDMRRATLPDLIHLAWGVETASIVDGPGWLGLVRFDVAAKTAPGSSTDDANHMLQRLLADRFALKVHSETRPLPAFTLRRGEGPLRLKRAEVAAKAGCSRSAPWVLACRNITMVQFVAGNSLRARVVDATGLEGAWDFDWPLQTGPESIGLKLEASPIPTVVLVVDSVNPMPTPNAPGISKALPERSLEFDAAAVKLSPPEEQFGFKRYPGGRLELHAFPMKMLIATAWDVDWDHMDERIAGAPKWVDTRRFDVVASGSVTPDGQVGSGFLDEDFQLMLRALLVDRFGVRTHVEDRLVPAYELSALKPHMVRANASRRSGCEEARRVADDPRDANPMRSRLIACHNVTMQQFAKLLQSMDRVEAAFNDVADATGLEGAYDFTISFSPRRLAEKSDGDPNGAIAFLDAVRQQLGLKLEKQKRMMPVLVVDQINETATEN